MNRNSWRSIVEDNVSNDDDDWTDGKKENRKRSSDAVQPSSMNAVQKNRKLSNIPDMVDCDSANLKSALEDCISRITNLESIVNTRHSSV